MDFLNDLNSSFEKKLIPQKIYNIIFDFYKSYKNSAKGFCPFQNGIEKRFCYLLKFIENDLCNPFQFTNYHTKIEEHEQFGLEFFRPLVIETHIFHKQNIEQIISQINLNENVILFSNHQTEIDPMLINLALEKDFLNFSGSIIFVAGDRVLSDPVAKPFSMGCNLLCIFSRRHMRENKEQKLKHNQKTMKIMRSLLEEGGKCIYLAPGGGRDRKDNNGVIKVSEFDPDSIEMFRLMAKASKKTTHFYPLALKTFDLLPPPEEIEIDIGETRFTKRENIYFSFGDEINFDFLTTEHQSLGNRIERRKQQAFKIWSQVQKLYQSIDDSLL